MRGNGLKTANYAHYFVDRHHLSQFNNNNKTTRKWNFLQVIVIQIDLISIKIVKRAHEKRKPEGEMNKEELFRLIFMILATVASISIDCNNQTITISSVFASLLCSLARCAFY